MKCPYCNIDLDKNNTCPNCKFHLILMEEEVKIHDGYGYKKKNRSLYHSKKHTYFEEVKKFMEWNRNRKEFVICYRKEDRLNDKYEERIKTVDGTTIVNKNESLHDHRNHGNAKNVSSHINKI